MKQKLKVIVISMIALLNLTACQVDITKSYTDNLAGPENCYEDNSKQNNGILNFVTYVNIDGIYIPVSYIKNGAQLLSGNVGPYSTIGDTLLRGIQDVEKLKVIEVPNSGAVSREDLRFIASDGTWEFFPDDVVYRTYSLNDQPNQPEWFKYFEEKLADLNYDGPIIIQHSVTFQWNGVETALVTASNVFSLEEYEDNCGRADSCQVIRNPANAVPSIYTISALFTQGSDPTELFNQYFDISKNQSGDINSGVAYVPRNDECNQYMQSLWVFQYGNFGNIELFPLFSNMNGSLNIRDFGYKPRFLVSDIDGDKKSEVVFCITRDSSSMSFCKVYKIENTVPKEAYYISLN